MWNGKDRRDAKVMTTPALMNENILRDEVKENGLENG
jgi:hypothetical protein